MEWIFVDNDLPPYGKRVLIWRKNYPIHIAYLAKLGEFDYFVIEDTIIAFPATHWTSMPEIPKE